MHLLLVSLASSSSSSSAACGTLDFWKGTWRHFGALSVTVRLAPATLGKCWEAGSEEQPIGCPHRMSATAHHLCLCCFPRRITSPAHGLPVDRSLPLHIFIPSPLFFTLARLVLVRCPPFLGTSVRPATHPVAAGGCAFHLQRSRPTPPCAAPWRARRPSSLGCCCGAPRASSSSSSLCCESSHTYSSGAAGASVPVDGGGRAKGLVVGRTG